MYIYFRDHCTDICYNIFGVNYIYIHTIYLFIVHYYFNVERVVHGYMHARECGWKLLCCAVEMFCGM